MAAINLGKPEPLTLAPRRKSRQIKVGKVLVGGDGVVRSAELRGDRGGEGAACVHQALLGASFALEQAPSRVTLRLQLHKVAP